MLYPDYLDTLGDLLLTWYDRLTATIIRDIVRRIVKTGAVTRTAAHQTIRIQAAGALYDDIIIQSAAATGKTETQIKALFAAAGSEAIKNDNIIYKAAGFTPQNISPAALQVLDAGAKKTSGLLNNLTMTTAVSAQQTFIHAATLAEMQIESGAFDYASAIRNAVTTVAEESGFVLYPSGHRDHLDVATRRAVLTGVNQTAAHISITHAQNMGCDLVETTAHPGARLEHAIWQGKVFSLSGKGRYPPFIETGYGTGAGLCGWNCRHNFYPYFDEISANAYPKEKLLEYDQRTVMYQGKPINYYDATQKQRKFERDIRSIKRTLTAYDEAIKNGAAYIQQDFTEMSVKLKHHEAALKDFLQQTGLVKDNTRALALGFGHSQAAKTVWAVRHNTLTNAAGDTIIKTRRTTLRAPTNSITQIENTKGGIDRNYYDASGKQIKQISNNGHGHAKEEAIGIHGEHAHDYVYDNGSILQSRIARELTEKERYENGDIL